MAKSPSAAAQAQESSPLGVRRTWNICLPAGTRSSAMGFAPAWSLAGTALALEASMSSSAHFLAFQDPLAASVASSPLGSALSTLMGTGVFVVAMSWGFSAGALSQPLSPGVAVGAGVGGVGVVGCGVL